MEILDINKAKETIVYFVETGEINNTNLHDLIMSTAKKIQPSNMEPRLYIKTVETDIYYLLENPAITINKDTYDGLDAEDQEKYALFSEDIIKAYELWLWDEDGNADEEVASFKVKQEAEQMLFNLVYNKDFLVDSPITYSENPTELIYDLYLDLLA